MQSFGGVMDIYNSKIHWVKWQKLCDYKRDGGMDFWDLCSWRIIHYPDASLGRVLKSKYFPNCEGH